MRTRHAVTAGLAALAVGGGGLVMAAPGTLNAVHTSAATGAAAGRSGRPIDGVRITYLPGGLRAHGADDTGGPDEPYTSRDYTDGHGGGVTISVSHGPSAHDLAAFNADNWMMNVHRARVAGHRALRGAVPESDGGGAELMWVPRSGTGLTVIASPRYAGRLDRIAAGLKPAR